MSERAGDLTFTCCGVENLKFTPFFLSQISLEKLLKFVWHGTYMECTLVTIHNCKLLLLTKRDLEEVNSNNSLLQNVFGINYYAGNKIKTFCQPLLSAIPLLLLLLRKLTLHLHETWAEIKC